MSNGQEWCQECETLREEIRILREHAEDLLKEKGFWRKWSVKLAEDITEEANEFNAGHDAFMEGLSANDEPSTIEHDMWLPGFAWAKYLEENKPCAEETTQR